MGSLPSNDVRENPLIVALDNMPCEKLFQLADQLRPTKCILKVEDVLFNEGIANFLPTLSTYGRVMADMKLHGIPSTVEHTCRHLHICPPWAVTAHTSGGTEMLKAARKALPAETKLLAVTVLTSLSTEDCQEVFVRLPEHQAGRLADMAWKAGANGFVCSAREAKFLRITHPQAEIVVTGVRSPGVDTNDQKRVETPAQALENRADKVVMGRQFTNNPDPLKEIYRVLRDELHFDI